MKSTKTPPPPTTPAPAAPANAAAPSGTAGVGGTAPPGGIEALADSLSACADALHERTMRAIRQRAHGHGASASGHEPAHEPAHDLAHGITQDAAQALLDDEVRLRQYANRLYVQAAVLATEGLDSVCQELMDVTAMARERLRRVAKVQALAALAADLVALGAAVATGKPAQWPAALKQVRDGFAAVHDEGKG